MERAVGSGLWHNHRAAGFEEVEGCEPSGRSAFEGHIMLEISPDTPDHILVISAVGRVTDDDYRTLLIPAAEEKIRRHGKIRMLYQIGPRFESFAPRAVMDDALFGLKHLGHFERIAVVTDVEWCRHAVGMMGWMVPCPVRLFANDQIAAAQAWIRELS